MQAFAEQQISRVRIHTVGYSLVCGKLASEPLSKTYVVVLDYVI